MPKYLIQVSYTADGAKGIAKDGGTKRHAAARSLIESLGGKLETMYFAFGETDVFAIADFPDNAAAAACSIAVGGSGAARSHVTVLLSPEELDQAMKKSPTYTPPGR